MFGLGKLGKMGRVGGKVRTLAALLSKYGSNAHAYLPGIGTISGLPTENYTSSTGDTGYSAVDGVVGLALDGMGTVGAELVTNGDNEAAVFTLGTMSTGNVAAARVAAVGGRSGSVMLATSSSAASVNHQYNCGAATMAANTAYRITVDMYVPTGGVANCLFFDNGDGSYFSPNMTTKDAWVTVSVIRPAKSASWNLGFGNNIPEVVANGNPAFYLDNVSIKPITGIQASNPTTEKKPLLTRGARNLLTWSRDISNGAWLKTNVTNPISSTVSYQGVACTEITDNATLADHKVRQVVTVAAGTVVTFAAIAKAGTLGYVSLYDGYADSGRIFNASTGASLAAMGAAPTSTFADLGDGFFLFTVSYTTSTTVRPEFGVLADGVTVNYAGTGKHVNLAAVGLFAGSLTASQILAQGGIPLTTTAAASNPLAGSYSWAFDGSNDSLALGSVPFQQTDDHCVVALVKPTATGRVFSISSNTDNNPRIADISLNASGYASVFWRDNAATAASVTGSVNLFGGYHIITAWNVAGVRVVRVDGVQIGTVSTTLGATTVTHATLGALQLAAVGNYGAGDMGGVLPIKGTLALQDVAAIERLVGQLAGVTI